MLHASNQGFAKHHTTHSHRLHQPRPLSAQRDADGVETGIGESVDFTGLNNRKNGWSALLILRRWMLSSSAWRVNTLKVSTLYKTLLKDPLTRFEKFWPASDQAPVFPDGQ